MEAENKNIRNRKGFSRPYFKKEKVPINQKSAFFKAIPSWYDFVSLYFYELEL